MAIDAEKLLNWPSKDVEQIYTKRDTMLYALGLGFGSEPTNEGELNYVYEEKLLAVPTMAVVLGSPGFWLRDPETGVDWKRVLHGEQWLEIMQPIPAEGAVIGRTKVTDILDKGPDKGAIIYSSREIVDKASGEPLARVSMSTFCRGDGGFGGKPGPAPSPHPIPETAPDLTCDLSTQPQAALIYRLSGDYNPLHADPKVAQAAGFPRPILHGLATYGCAARAVLKACCDYDPSRLRSLSVRFSAPVFPGESLRIEMWRETGGVAFRARVNERDSIVMTNGFAGLE